MRSALLPHETLKTLSEFMEPEFGGLGTGLRPINLRCSGRSGNRDEKKSGSVVGADAFALSGG